MFAMKVKVWSILLILVFGVAIIWWLIRNIETRDSSESISIGDMATILNDPVERREIVSIQSGPGDTVHIYRRDGESYITYKDSAESLPSQLRSLGVSDNAIIDIQDRFSV